MKKFRFLSAAAGLIVITLSMFRTVSATTSQVPVSQEYVDLNWALIALGCALASMSFLLPEKRKWGKVGFMNLAKTKQSSLRGVVVNPSANMSKLLKLDSLGVLVNNPAGDTS